LCVVFVQNNRFTKKYHPESSNSTAIFGGMLGAVRDFAFSLLGSS